MRTLSAILYDIKFQMRHGFYYAYAFVSLLYIMLIRVMPVDTREYISILIIFTDPTVLGFFFIGGIVLLEKDQGIFSSIFVTPLKVREYIAAKLVSLTLISLLSSLVIAYFSTPGSFNPVLIIIAVATSSVFFTLMGLTLAVRVKSINGYILASPFFLTLFVMPLFAYLKFFEFPLNRLLPGHGSLQLLSGAYKGISLCNGLYSIILIMIWIVIAYFWAESWFRRYIISGIGGGSI